MKRPRKKYSAWRKVMRTAEFTLFQSRSQVNHWRSNWKDREGKWCRYKILAETAEEALEEARKLLTGNISEPVVSQEGPLVLTAFQLALAATKRNERSRRDWKRGQDRFLAWLSDHHPEAMRWKTITRQMFREYLSQTLPNAGANHKRLTMQPVLQTARFMWLEHEIPNVGERLGIGCKLTRQTPLVLLDDVMTFVDWLTRWQLELEAGAALQGLAGLQLQEALRLTWDKVDLEKGLIEISGEVKNAYRNRVIPVCGRLLDALKRADQRRLDAKVQPIGPAAVVPNPSGGSYADAEGSWKNYSHNLKEAILTWNVQAPWAPKDLRNALPTFFALQGIAGDLTEQYLGHAPKTVTGRHYVPRLASPTDGERRVLLEMMAKFRTMAVEPIEQELEKIARKSHEEPKEQVTESIQE